MGASPHSLPAQTHARRKDLVVREGGNMTKSEKPVRGIDWTAIFKNHPDLEPPGYHETIAKLYPKEKTDDTRVN